MNTASTTRTGRSLAVIGVGLILLIGFLWLGSRSDSFKEAYSVSGEKHDYYSLLVHNLSRGHLYMDVAVDPRALSPDPSERAKAELLLDASIYKGRYYLYFGIVPALVLLLPYHLVTGSDLSENTAVLLFVVAGFLIYWRIFSEARKRYFPNLSLGVYAACLALLAYGSGAPMLLTYAGFYEIAISAGYLFHALTWLGLFKALHSERYAGRWLGLASAAAGLAVGCRPNYIIVLPVVALAAAVLCRRGANVPRLISWAVLPASLVGLLLAVHNYARFGSPFEFGLSYQNDAMIGDKFPLFRLSFFWSNLKWYYLRPPAYSLYFPFVYPMNANVRPDRYYGYETIHGQLPVMILATLTLIGWIIGKGKDRPSPSLSWTMGLLAVGFTILFLGIAFYSNRAERYTVDFQASLSLLIAIGAGYIASGAGNTGAMPFPGIGRIAFITVAYVGALSNVLAGLQLNERFESLHPRAWSALTYWGNFPSAVLGRFGLIHYGPIRFKTVIPPLRGDVNTAPLLATGLPNRTDVLYLTQVRGNTVQFSVSHTGYGDVKSALLIVDPSKEHELEVDLGSLYPPRGHPWFRGKNAEDIQILKTTAVVRLDGKIIIQRRVPFFDSPPGWIYFGRNPAGTDKPYEGRIWDCQLLPPRLPETLKAQAAEVGVWRIALTFPFDNTGMEQPVLGSGAVMHGNLLVLKTLNHHMVQFGLDQWGLELVESPSIPVEGDGLHHLEIFVGAQVARSALPTALHFDPTRLAAMAPFMRIWLDGKPVWTARLTLNSDTYGNVSIGSNPQGFSSSRLYYFGSIESEALTPEELTAIIDRNVREGAGIAGIRKYKVEFPQASGPAAGLPLIGLGITGHGNMLYARATGRDLYRVGLDDWGTGAQEGAPFDVKPGEHMLEIVLGPILANSLSTDPQLSRERLSPLRSRILVFFDRQQIGDFKVVHHLDMIDTLTPGSNPQGFSSATAGFTGAEFAPEPMTDQEAKELIARALASGHSAP